MANQRRDTAWQIAFCPDGKIQADFATAIPSTNFTARFPDTARNFYKLNPTYQDIEDCGGEELYARILRGQVGELTITFNVGVNLLAVMAAYGMGVAAAPTGTTPKIHALSELPRGTYQPPPFGLIVNFEGQSDAIYLRGCVVDSFSPKAAAGLTNSDVTCDVTIRFVEAVVLAGFTFPACVNYVPLRFSDCVLTVGGVDLSASGRLRSFDYSFANSLAVDDSAFTTNSTLPGRLERASKRARKLDYVLFGDNKDSEFTSAVGGAYQAAWTLLIGGSTLGITFSAANSSIVLNGGGLTKTGSLNETAISLTATPIGATTATVRNAQTTQYLLTS